jgi:hypothetical protein
MGPRGTTPADPPSQWAWLQKKCEVLSLLHIQTTPKTTNPARGASIWKSSVIHVKFLVVLTPVKLYPCVIRNLTFICLFMVITNNNTKRVFRSQGKRKLALPPPPPILQIMMLKLSPPRCIISKESVQQKWIDELWFRKQLSTCLFVWILNYNDLVRLLIDV